MNRIRIFLDGDEIDGLMAEADRNLRGMGEQARWWIRQGIAGTLPICLPGGTGGISELPRAFATRRTVGVKEKQSVRGDSGGLR